MRSPVRRTIWNLWFAWQAQHNLIKALHPEQPNVPFSWGTVFGRKLFTLCDPDLIHQVLVSNHKSYQKGQLFQRLLRPATGESVLTAEGDSWAYRRKMIAPAFHPRAIKALENRMSVQIDMALAESDETLETDTWAPNLALNIALDGLFSGAAGDKTPHLAHHMQAGIDLFGRMSTADVLNLPNWWPRPAKRQARRHADAVDEIIYELIEDRKNAAQVQEKPDLLDMILGARDAETGEGLAHKDVRNEVFTFFAAGHDTSANALQWALYVLADRPDLQAQAAEDPEVLDRVISEVLRLYPTAFNLVREVVAGDVLAGVTAPVGALVLIPLYAYHRSPLYWAKPEDFDPDHFLPDQVAQRPKHAYLPFGLGPRVCPGKMMALQTLKLVMGKFLKAFEFSRIDSNPIEPFGRITLRPSHSMTLALKPRA